MKYILTLMLLLNTVWAEDSPTYIITIPKTGTNLLLKLVFLIDQANGIDPMASHYNSPLRITRPDWFHQWQSSQDDSLSIGPTQEKIDTILKNKGKVLIVIRDPRALINSISPKDPEGNPLPGSINQLIDEHSLKLSEIAGNNYFLQFNSLRELYQEYLKWAAYSFTYVARFENLVGEEGGGCKETQIQEIINIAQHLEKPISKESAYKIADQLFGESDTFRVGQIDNWRLFFTPADKEKFLSKEIQLLLELDYILW